MKKTDNVKAGIVDTYKYSLKHRISALYTMIYIIVCIIVILLFAVGSMYYETKLIKLQTDVIVKNMNTVLSGTDPYGDDFRFYLNSLRREGSVDEVYLYDSEGKFVNGTKTAVKTSGFAAYSARASLHGKMSLRDKSYTDQAVLSLSEAEYTLVICYDITASLRSAAFGITTMTICMVIGLAVFTVAGAAQTTRMLKPLSEISHVAKKISGENLNLRIDVENTRFELGELSETINDMMDRIELSYDRQKRFVSDVSHELRTPIAVISGYGSMLKRWGRSDEAILDESINAIIDETQNMQDLVEKLLFLTRNDNKTAKYEFKPINVSALTSSVVKEEMMVHSDFEVKADIAADITAEIDEMSIKQIMRILIDNAVKYSADSKTVEIGLKGMQNYFEFSVKDSGIGINKKDLPHIFDRFYRADESRARQSGGYGLGLAIAKAVAQGHGGHITVLTKPSEGTRFTVEIPYKQNL